LTWAGAVEIEAGIIRVWMSVMAKAKLNGAIERIDCG